MTDARRQRKNAACSVSCLLHSAGRFAWRVCSCLCCLQAEVTELQSKLWENDEMTEEEAEEITRKAERLKIKMVRASERMKQWGMETGLNRSAKRDARTHARTHARQPRGAVCSVRIRHVEVVPGAHDPLARVCRNNNSSIIIIINEIHEQKKHRLESFQMHMTHCRGSEDGGSVAGDSGQGEKELLYMLLPCAFLFMACVLAASTVCSVLSAP